MSDIVIRGIEIPKDKQYALTIFPGGRVIQHWDGVVFGETEAIELPPYGRLIDADALPIKDEWSLVETNVIWDAPTILEANKE